MKKVSNSFGLLIIAVMVFHLISTGFAQQNESENQQAADKQTYLANLSETLNKQHPDNRMVNIVCFGNSVPAGYTKAPIVDPFSAYPHLFHKGLKEKYPYAITNVIVSAKGGETTMKGIIRFGGDVRAFAPDLITIDYALTDRFLPLKISRTNLKLMIETAKSSGIKVLLLTPTPDLLVDMNDPNHPLNKQAKQIRNLAIEYEVGLVDSYAVQIRRSLIK